MRALCLLLVASVAAASPPTPPHGISRVVIRFQHSGYFPGAEHRFELAWRADGSYVGTPDQHVPAAMIEKLVDALDDRQPVAHRLTCNAYADNNDNIVVELVGKPSIKVEAHDNCPHHMPWSVVIDGKAMYEPSTTIDDRVMALLVALDPTTKWPVDTSRNSSVPFPVTDGSSADAKACAKDLEATLAKSAGITAEVQIGSLDCDLKRWSDCTTLDVRGSLRWHGASVFGLSASCKAGHGQLDVAPIATVRPLLDSPLMHAVVGVGNAGILVEPHGKSWKIVGIPGLADATYDPATKRLYTAGLASPLWKALGIADVPTQPELTLDGKLVK